MRFLRLGVLVIFCGVLLAGCSLPGQKAGFILTVMNSEQADIYVAGKKLGEAPLQKNDMKPGTYDIKIVPRDTAKQSYETKLQFVGGVTTRMNWNIGATVDESSGEIFESKPYSGKEKVQMSVITIPDTAIVRVDGQSRGLSPLTIDIDPGTKDIQVSAPGYFERRVTPTVPKGMQTQITVKLAVNRETLAPPATPIPTPVMTASVSATPKSSPKATPKATSSAVLKASPTATPKVAVTATPKASASPTAKPATSSGAVRGTSKIEPPYIEIKETPTGWLRVRKDADANAEELAKLNTGEKVSYMDETKGGWHKVEYASGKEGWVSAQYSVLHQ